VRFELTAGDERRQVLWLIAGTCGVVFLNIAALLPDDGATPGWLGLLLGAMSLLGPAGIAIATLAPRMFDVRAVISRTLLLVVMLTVVVAAFAVVDGSIHWATGEQPPIGALGLLAALIAAAYHPVLVRARATLDELLFGGRADPVDTLTRLGSELSAGSSPQEWLDTLRAALAVPALELRRDDEVLARSGPAPSPPSAPGGEREVAVTPLRVGADPVGELVVTLPADQLHLAPTTRAVLTLVAGPLAQALHAVRLTEQLQASRGRVVAALEEERRRVRRDLHDGLGPTLTGIAYSADAVTNLVGSDPDRAAAVLSGLREDAADAIAEVRRIVYGLRPRALDELGLVNAVRQRLERLHAADGRPFVVDVTAPGALPALSAAVEVAAYRVAVEAVTNVARHAGVAAACVRFRLPETGLEIEVTDAGRPGATWRAGVGLDSMRERVEQLGGNLVAGPTPEGGRVHASVPLVLPG
jgi:signal transduction histidine kinase